MEPLEPAPDEPSEPSEPDFGVYIGTKKIDFGLEDTKKYVETSYRVVLCDEFDGANEKS